MLDKQPMKTLSYRSGIRVLGGINHNSSKTVLNMLEPAKIKSRETSAQGITAVKMTFNQSVSGQKSSFTRLSHEIRSLSVRIPDLNTTSITGNPLHGKRRENPNQIRHQGS